MENDFSTWVLALSLRLSYVLLYIISEQVVHLKQQAQLLRLQKNQKWLKI